MAIRELQILISAKDTASGTFDKIGGKLGVFGKGLGIAVGGLAATGAALGVVGTGLAKLAIDAAPLEQIKDAFEGIAIASGESAPKVLAALEQASAGMIAQRDLMTSYNKAAQLVSTTFANQLPQAMESLGKVAASTGQDMGFLLDSLVTGVGRMSPMILDNLGIQVELSEATAKAAEMFGVEAEELTKSQEQAGLMNVVLEKLAANTANMPEIAGTATAAFGQFNTTMQNLKDQIGLQLLPVITPFLQAFAQLAQEFLPLAVAKFAEFGAKMQETVGPAMLLINDALTRMGEAMGLASEDVTAMDVVLKALEGLLNVIVIAIQAFAIGMQAAAAAVEAVSAGIQSLNNFIQSGISLWQQGADALSGFASSIPGSSYIIGHSPSPLENSLRGITSAMQEMTSIGNALGNTTLPNLSSGAMAAGAMGGSQSINIYLDGQQIAGALIRGGNPDARRKSGGMTNL